MPRVTIWVLSLLASCVLVSTPALADKSVKLTIAGKPSPAPAILFKDNQSNAHTLNPQQHKLSIVHFWATWCAPCVAELPEVDATAKAYADKGLHVVAISLDGDMDKVTQFFDGHKITNLTPFLDMGNVSFRSARLQGLPDTIFVDSSGNEIARAEGPLDWKSKEVTEFIEEHLK